MRKKVNYQRIITKKIFMVIFWMFTNLRHKGFFGNQWTRERNWCHGAIGGWGCAWTWTCLASFCWRQPYWYWWWWEKLNYEGGTNFKREKQSEKQLDFLLPLLLYGLNWSELLFNISPFNYPFVWLCQSSPLYIPMKI